MSERQRPLTPRPDQLREEKAHESVRIIDHEEMEKGLRELFPDKDVQERLFPLLLKYAGRSVAISHVPAIIADAVRLYVRNNSDNLRNYNAKNTPLIIDVMVADVELREKAKRFLTDALNG